MHQPSEDGRASGAGVQIELQPPSMDRGRSNTTSRGRAAKKRATFPSHSFHAESHPFSNSASPTTPEASAPSGPSQRMSHTAPQRGAKARQATSFTTPHRASSPAADQAMRITARTDRPARSSTFHASSSFSFESPSAAGSIMAAGPARKRSRTFETPYDGAADDEGHSKGGHSLRKRARVDYTQEMIEDDLGLPAARNDSAAKPATTPSARGRKRKGGHDESDGESEASASNPKRHRADKSPAPSRAASSRRRNTSKKLSTDLTPYVDQPSDNEVQDTILVSLPTGPGAPSEESETSSPTGSPDSRRTSSNASEAAPINVQPPTPQVQPSRPAEDAVSVAAENGEAVDIGSIPEQRDDKPQVAHVMMLAVEVEQPQRTSEDETKRSDLVVPKILQQLETTNSPRSEATKTEAREGEGAAPPSQGEPSHQAATSESIEIPATTNTPTPEPNPPPADTTASRPPHSSEVATVTPIVSRTPSDQEIKPPGPGMIKALERIYNQTRPFASQLKLTPYETEGVALPGPYTEWVHPARTAKDQPTPMPVPTPVPSPPGSKPGEVAWDARRRLKTGEFFALYQKESKRRQEKGEPPISMMEFNNECARRYKSAHSEDADTPSSTTESTTSSTVVAERPTDVVVPSIEEDTPRASQAIDSPVPTAAPSPAPLEEDAMIQDEAAEDEQDVDEPIDEPVKPDSPGEPVEVTRNPSKQYLFPKIRDPNDFVEAFEGWQDFSTDRLYETIAAATEAMDAYQQEYYELKKFLDDEENAKRRQANDKTISNWENRQKADEPLPLRRHFDDAVKGPAVFEVRGVRAPKPYVDDPVLEHQKEEDRIMAQAYGFKLNTHPTQVGRQNPEEQRWEMPENRLRKRTEKGAELAEDNVVEGKRARKPRHVSDQSKDPSRAGTPTGFSAFGPGRRQRRKPAAAGANGDDAESVDQTPFGESFSESPRKGRPARARGVMLPGDQEQVAPVAEADDNRTDDDEPEGNEKAKVPRRRGRVPATLPEPPTSVPAGLGDEAPKPKRVRNGKGQQVNQQGAGEIASSSFYSNATSQPPDSRPSTASSEGTAHTAETTESTYSLRDKRKRNFALENDPELEVRPQRRGRGPAAPKQDAKQDAPQPKKRGPRKKEPVFETAAPPPGSEPSPVPHQASPPPLQQPAATKFYHNFVSGPMVVDVANGSQPAPMSPQEPAAAAPFMHTFNAAPAFLHGAPPPPPDPPVKKPITKIRFKNNGNSQAASRSSTPPKGKLLVPRTGKRLRPKKSEWGPLNGANGEAAEPDKPYAEMTKGEKMSWSMRRRWASGEMQGAVEKRRATLAIKKAEKAAGGSQGDGNESGSAGPSDPTTPASMHSQSGSGLLALPQSHPLILPAPAPGPPPAIQPQPQPKAKSQSQPPPQLPPQPQPQPPAHLQPQPQPQHQGFLQQPPPYHYGLPPGLPGHHHGHQGHYGHPVEMTQAVCTCPHCK